MLESTYKDRDVGHRLRGPLPKFGERQKDQHAASDSFSLAARADSFPLNSLCRSDPWCEKGSPKRVRFFQLSFQVKA